MKSRTKLVVEQLGMSHGTAMNRLRKMILFSLVQAAKRDICFVCGKRIRNVKDLSIEHKEPWEGRSAKLFWSLDNIAFSHLRCNRPHSYGAKKLRRVGPEGTAWCNTHKKFLPVANFWKQTSSWNGVHRTCAECMTKQDCRNNHARYTKQSLRA